MTEVKEKKLPKLVLGTNARNLNRIPIIGALMALTVILPFAKIPALGGNVSAVELALAEQSFSAAALLVIVLPALIGLALSILVLLAPSKTTVRISVVGFALCFASAVVVMFTCAKVLNGSGLLEGKFLVRDLGFGYWLFLAISLAGLIISMLAAKLSPGYILLIIMSVIWLFPIIWIVMISFRAETGSYTSYFIPKSFTLDNYKDLLTETELFHFARWFQNTMLVAVLSCVLSTIIVLSTAFSLSRIRFRGRKGLMNIMLILGMFPGFMSMIAVYYILKGLGINQSLAALVLVYAGGSAMGYYIAKGFFDTIPKSIDEAAYLDGASKWTVFTKITIPISKPVIIYTVLTSFMSPWADYIFAKVIMGDNYKNYTVALGLYSMLQNAYIDKWYTKFAAGAVLISIPIAILFILMQKYYVEGLSGAVKE